jgi:hypothetical protein
MPRLALHPAPAQPDQIRRSGVKVERLHRLADLGPKFVPGVGLRESAFAKRLGRKTNVSLLRNFKSNLLYSVHFSGKHVAPVALSPPTFPNSQITLSLSSEDSIRR